MTSTALGRQGTDRAGEDELRSYPRSSRPGFFGLVYIALAFILPVAATRET